MVFLGVIRYIGLGEGDFGGEFGWGRECEEGLGGYWGYLGWQYIEYIGFILVYNQLTENRGYAPAQKYKNTSLTTNTRRLHASQTTKTEPQDPDERILIR